MAGTLQVFSLSDKICGQCPLSRLAGYHHWYTALRAFIGRETGHKAFNPFAAEILALCSKPVRIRVPGWDLPTRSKVAFGGALKESLHESCRNFHIHQTTVWLKFGYEDLCAGLPKGHVANVHGLRLTHGWLSPTVQIARLMNSLAVEILMPMVSAISR
jgi:hypothetical protein